MGRDWSRSGGGGGGGGSRGVRRSSTTTAGGEKETQLGCISSVLHFFDFHQLHCVSFGAHGHQHEHEQQQQQKLRHRRPAVLQQDRDPSKLDGSISHHTPPPKGLEAPRNSLELQEGTASSPSSAATKEDQEDENIPFSVLQLVPVLKPSSSPSSDREAKDHNVQRSSPSPSPFSDDTNSHGSKTPNLVARLMGLDLLPDETSSATSSPMYRRSSNGKYHHHQSHQPSSSSSVSCSRPYESGSRSLPDTPRISSARRSTDVDPRYSLQLNKENNTCNEAAAASSSPSSARRLSGSGRIRRDMKLMMVKPREDGKISPSKYAREIVRQVKENVSRKVGADITNTITGCRGDKRDSNSVAGNSPKLVLMRKNSSGMKLLLAEAPTQSKHSSSSNISSTSSRSPRFTKASKQKPAENLIGLPQIPEINEYSKPDNHCTDQTSKAKAKPTRTSSSSSSYPMPKPTTKCKKDSCERFTRKPKKLQPPETFENLRAEALPRRTSPSKSKVLQGRTVVGPNGDDSSPSSFGIGNNNAIPYKDVEAPAAALGVRDDKAEFRYVRTILEHAGIETGEPPKWWYSGHPPLDRSLFRALEMGGGNAYTPPSEGPTSLASYRSLLFDLAGEVVAGILKPGPVAKPWRSAAEAVWGRVVKGYPGAKCKTLQDIDALVGSEMTPETAAAEEEDAVDAVVGEIEREVVASLVAETAAGLLTAP